MTSVASRGWGSPLPGPLDIAPHGVSAVEARVMLDRAVDGLPLGTYDRCIASWLAVWDQPTVAVLASLLARARRQGSAARWKEPPGRPRDDPVDAAGTGPGLDSARLLYGGGGGRSRWGPGWGRQPPTPPEFSVAWASQPQLPLTPLTAASGCREEGSRGPKVARRAAQRS
jgi:hypothetical protein